MYSGKLVFTQLMDPLPWHGFRRCVARYHGNHKVKSFTCADQFRCMAFAQLTYRSSLRDIEACLRVHPTKLYHMGIRGRVSRHTLAHANAVRGWQIYADFAQHLIHAARNLHADDGLPGLDLGNTVYALDSSTIDLCLSLFPWAPFRRTKAAVKLHTLLDLHGHIPAFIHISDGKLHDVNVLDMLLPEAGAFYIMDRAYLDFGSSITCITGAASLSCEQHPTPGCGASILVPSTAPPASSVTRSYGPAASAVQPTIQTSYGTSDTGTPSATRPPSFSPTTSSGRP